MPRKRRRQKNLLKSLKKPRAVKDSSVAKVPEIYVFKPDFQKQSLLLRLASNPRFVGAMRWMLRGCFASGSAVALLFIYPDWGKRYATITYKIASFAPRSFLSPEIYIPGALTMPLLLILVTGFAAFGYMIGSEPPEIETDKDTRSFYEKLFEFLFLLGICLLFGFFRFKSDYPGIGFMEMISDVFFIIFIVIVALAVSYYVFSRQQSTGFLIFVLESSLAVGFVLFLIGLIAYSLFECFRYALDNYQSGAS